MVRVGKILPRLLFHHNFLRLLSRFYLQRVSLLPTIHNPQLCLRAMGFFDVVVAVLHWLAESAELERERRQRQPATEERLEGRRRALGGMSDADRLLHDLSNLMRDLLSTVTVAFGNFTHPIHFFTTFRLNYRHVR